MCFWVSSGVRLGVRAWNPSVFSMRLTVQTETSVPAATKSCCRCFAVTRGFLTTCLLRNLVAAADSFLFLPRPGSVATVPSFNFELANYASNCISRDIQCFCYLCVSFSLFVQGNDLFSELFGQFFLLISNMQSNVTLNKPLASPGIYVFYLKHT